MCMILPLTTFKHADHYVVVTNTLIPFKASHLFHISVLGVVSVWPSGVVFGIDLFCSRSGYQYSVYVEPFGICYLIIKCWRRYAILITACQIVTLTDYDPFKTGDLIFCFLS